MRKAYIVQFAPDGAEVIRPGADGARGVRVPANEASRQFEVVRGGQPVTSEATRSAAKHAATRR